MRNRYVQEGFIASIKFRRTLVAALYDKVVKLSVKSMTETNSGKLISLISADLFAIERGLSFCPTIIAAPFINMVAYGFLWSIIGFGYTMIVLGFWILVMILQ